MCRRPGSRSSIASYSASVWPPGTPKTCRTPCSASKLASSAPPCWEVLARGGDPPEPPAGLWPRSFVTGPWPCWLASGSGIGHPEQLRRGAAEDGFLVGAEAERADLTDGVVGSHVERPVRA